MCWPLCVLCQGGVASTSVASRLSSSRGWFRCRWALKPWPALQLCEAGTTLQFFHTFKFLSVTASYLHNREQHALDFGYFRCCSLEHCLGLFQAILQHKEQPTECKFSFCNSCGWCSRVSSKFTRMLETVLPPCQQQLPARRLAARLHC